ncbi:helix-turn-helix domain-containing protein [Blastococcus sp. CT_GayMR16]|uniref:helix-turn-helix domain-containing protein n=1 Tax=Blastococcus sp. CT_GayMR16 TaxID=2559607 RepID=UPI001431DFB8|nr:helix-turn-helix domain-containing protein [Blastococcus sp. CT_GayMR16]
MSEKLAAALAVEIKRLCEERGWSGRELARRTGLVPSVMAYKLGGERPFDVDDVAAVAAAFEMTASELVGLAER